MFTRAYCRCNSGHYFAGEYCPFDGWSSPASKELTEAVKRLAREDRLICLEELGKAGVSAATLTRTIVIEFGASASVFDAISPQEVVVNGEAQPLRKLSRAFK
jgi:hypothetical protein